MDRILHKNDILKDYIGKLKYKKEKFINVIELIDKYIYRIEENISDVKCSDTSMEEEYRNKYLVKEIDEFLKELEGKNNEN